MNKQTGINLPPASLPPQIQVFVQEDGAVPFWDHPNFTSRIVLPDEYRPITRVEAAIELMNRNVLDENTFRVLKVVGDAICTNELQIRRYLSRFQANSATSKMLRRLSKYGFVERHVCRLQFIEEEGEEMIRPPAPFTLGIIGKKVLEHFYPEGHYLPSEMWRQNSAAVQRYIGMNEIRSHVTNSRKAKSWLWQPAIGGHSKYRRPFAVMTLKPHQVQDKEVTLQFVMERAQMTQDFIGFLRDRLEFYRYLIERDSIIQVDGAPKSSVQVVLLSVSTLSLAEHIQQHMHLEAYKFHIWFLVDEWIDERLGLLNAFGRVDAKTWKVVRMRVDAFR